jgi:hypothetical protein
MYCASVIAPFGDCRIASRMMLVRGFGEAAAFSLVMTTSVREPIRVFVRLR